MSYLGYSRSSGYVLLGGMTVQGVVLAEPMVMARTVDCSRLSRFVPTLRIEPFFSWVQRINDMVLGLRRYFPEPMGS